jgi:hypothetical protein
MSRNEFSVYQWFPDGSYERVREFVSAEEAVRAFMFYTTNVAAKHGITQKVMITDGGDSCVREWITGKGVVYPKESEGSCETHKD